MRVFPSFQIKAFSTKILVLALCFELVFGPLAASQAFANSSGQGEENGAPRTAVARTDAQRPSPEAITALEAQLREAMSANFLSPSNIPEVRQAQAILADAAQVLDRGLTPEERANFNPGLIKNQVLRMIDPHTGARTTSHDLSRLNQSLPTVTFSEFSVRSEANALVLVGLSGGVPVAEHEIPGLSKIIGMHRDREMILLLDEEGKIHALDTADTQQSIFRGPINVMRNVDVLSPEALNALRATTPRLLAGQSRIRFSFQTVGLRPFPEAEIPDSAVRGRTRDGRAIYAAGDFVVYLENQDGSRALLSVVPRADIHRRIARDLNALLQVGAVVAPESLTEAQRAEVARRFIEATPDAELSAAATDSATPSGLIRRALIAISSRAPQLLDRRDEHLDLADRTVHRFTYAEYQESYARIEAAARRVQTSSFAAEQALPRDIVAGLSSSDYGPFWRPLLAEENRVPPTERISFLRRAMNVVLKKHVIAGMAGAGAYAAGYNGYGPQFFVEGVLYANEALSTVLPIFKNLNYLVFPGAASVVAQLLALQLFFGIGWASIPLLDKFADSIQRIAPRRAHTLKEITNRWRNSDSFRRILGFSMRMMSVMIPNALNFPFQLARQPNMLRTAARGMNPFRTITPDSALGQAANITEPIRAGAVNPFASRERRTQTLDAQGRAMGAMEESRIRTSVMAHLLADIVVAEQEGIPLSQLVQEGLEMRPGTVRTQLQGEAAQGFYDNTMREIYQFLISAQGRNFTLQTLFNRAGADIDRAELYRYITEAREAAARVRARGLPGQTAVDWFRSAQNWFRGVAPAFIDFNRREAQILATLMPPEFTVSQVRPELVAEWNTSSWLPLFLGGRANPDHPDRLMANTNPAQGFTSGVHWMDMAYGAAWATLFETAQMVIQFYEAPETQETNYGPPEVALQGYADEMQRSGDYKGLELFAPKEDTLGRSFWKFTQALFRTTPSSGNLITEYIRAHFIYMRRIQPQMITYMAMRMGLVGQNVSEAFLSSTFHVLAGHAFISPSWMTLRVGMRNMGREYSIKTEEFTVAMTELSQALRTEAPVGEVSEAYAKLRALYEGDSAPRELAEQAQELLSHARELPDAATMREMIARRDVLVPYFGSVARLQYMLEHGNAEQIRAAYDQLVSYYRSQNAEAPTEGSVADEAERLVREARAEANPTATDAENLALIEKAQTLLDHAKESPPFPTAFNEGVRTWMIRFCIVASMIGGIELITLSISPEVISGRGPFFGFSEHLKWVGYLATAYGASWFTLTPPGRASMRALGAKLGAIGRYYKERCEALLAPRNPSDGGGGN